MKAEENDRGGIRRPDGRSDRRLPYEAPRILDRERLEVVAGVCGTPGNHKTNPIDCNGKPQKS